MKMSISKCDLLDYVVNQLRTFSPDKTEKEYLIKVIIDQLNMALDRTEYCFSKIKSKYFTEMHEFNSEILFNHLNADQYAMFLYFLSNTLYKNGSDLKLCSKIFLLNKCLHGIDAFYEIELPDIFLFVHPVGTVLGRGKYFNYFIVYQRCGVGDNKGNYPTLKEHVTLHPGASVLGNCVVGENCKIAAGSLLLDKNLEKNSIYIGNPRDFIIRKSDEKNHIWR